MAVFKNDPEVFHRLDWSILQNGWSSMYWKTHILNKDIEWFQNDGYDVIEFDSRSWDDLSKMHRDLQRMLDFPDYYGQNFDALNDCLSDLNILESGKVIVLRHFDSIGIKNAHMLLDIFAVNSRHHMLFGKKLIVLLQVDDSNYQLEDLGASSVLWNRAEWMDENRR
jgi:RNAse (barnase) inhibitor barstar